MDKHFRPEGIVQGERRIIWHASGDSYERAYEKVTRQPRTPPGAFSEQLRRSLRHTDYVTFFCDDDILYRDITVHPVALLQNPEVFTVSMRLGQGSHRLPPKGFPVWRWARLDRTDFGFPCSIDGHTFRAYDVERMIGSEEIPNPTMLETVMAMRAELLAKERPLMACYEEQCLVGVPVNRVSENSGVPHGQKFPQSTRELNKRFLSGERIDLDALDFTGIDSCHHELEFKWRPR